MKKITLLLVSLIFSVLLFGCTNESQESLKIEKESEEKTLPSFISADMPSISLLSSSGEVINPTFDHSYEEVCWKNCDEVNQYNYPSLHSANVEIGNRLQINWESLEPQPTEVHLIQLDNIDEDKFKELSREPQKSENERLTITIEEEMIGNQYALEFLWKNETSAVGKSILNFKLEQ